MSMKPDNLSTPATVWDRIAMLIVGLMVVCLLGLALWYRPHSVTTTYLKPPEEIPVKDAVFLKSVHLIATDPAAAIYQRHRVPGTQELFRHDVNVYRLTYATHDVDGTEITVSGAVLVPVVDGPMPTMSYLRGTIIPIKEEKYAPSYYNLENNQSIYENYEMSYLAAGFAAAGYFTVAPDMIGYGASKDREHPYEHAPSLAWVSRDMLRAAHEFAKQEGIALDGRLFITGWSEGGLAGMALHELLEREPVAGFSVRGSSLLAGHYTPSAILDWFCCIDEPYGEPNIRYWMLRSMLRVHRIARPFDEIVRPEYAKKLMQDVMAPVPQNPRDGLTETFRTGMHNRTETEIRRAFEDSDRYDWRPLAPAFLHHGTHDDIVPFFAAQMAYQAMRARGGTVKLYPYIGKDHYLPVNTYVVRTLADFARLQGKEIN